MLNLQELQADTVQIGIDCDLPAITLEIVDPTGEGFRSTLDADEALDIALKLIGAVARVRRLDTGNGHG